jgi:hypothetical protein
VTHRLTGYIDRIGEKRIIVIIALVAFACQLTGLRAPEIYGEPYLIAKNIVAGKGFVFTYPFTALEGPTCYITPLYTYLQVPFLYSGLGERAIEVMNLLFLQLGCYVVYRFFRQFVSRDVAIAIFFALSFYVPFWILSYTLEPNSLNLLLLALTVDCVWRIAVAPARQQWIQLGLLFGVQLWVRPDVILGLAFFGVWLLLVTRERKLGILRGLALAALIGLVIIAPWTVRNYLTFHKFVLVSANSGMNLFVGNSSASTGEISDKPPTPEALRLYNAIFTYSLSHDQIEDDNYCKQIALTWIREHRADALALDLKKIRYHWFGRDELGTQYHYAYGALTTIYRIITFILLALALFGLIKLKDRRLRSLLITIFIYSTAISAIFFVQSRHRTLKVDPFLVPLAMIGISKLVRTSEPFGKLRAGS